MLAGLSTVLLWAQITGLSESVHKLLPALAVALPVIDHYGSVVKESPVTTAGAMR